MASVFAARYERIADRLTHRVVFRLGHIPITAIIMSMDMAGDTAGLPTT